MYVYNPYIDKRDSMYMYIHVHVHTLADIRDSKDNHICAIITTIVTKGLVGQALALSHPSTMGPLRHARSLCLHEGRGLERGAELYMYVNLIELPVDSNCCTCIQWLDCTKGSMCIPVI